MFWDNISTDAWVGILGTILGTVIGWLLSTINNIGITKISFVNVFVNLENMDETGNSCATLKVKFNMRITNNKPRPYGINDISIILKDSNGEDTIGRDIFSVVDEKNELDELMNVPAKETREAILETGHTILHPENLKQFEIYVKYRFNGKRFFHRRKIYKD